jgi:hypothetical protein
MGRLPQGVSPRRLRREVIRLRRSPGCGHQRASLDADAPIRVRHDAAQRGQRFVRGTSGLPPARSLRGMHHMRRRFASALVPVCLLVRGAMGCGTSSNLGGTPDGAAGATGTESDASEGGASRTSATPEAGSEPEAACPANVACGCTCPTVDEDGAVCICASFSMPACPAAVQTMVGLECKSSGSCMNCLGGAAGIICNCTDAGPAQTDAGGLHWVCIPTEQGCRGGTFHG